MKTVFSKNYILNNKGCYNTKQVESLDFDKNNEITLERLFEIIPIKDFTWFVCKKTELTTLQLRFFALSNASFALPIYEKHYPNDKRVRECIETTKMHLDGNATISELREKRAAAADAAADAAATAAYAAATAAYAAAYAADDAAGYAADAAAYADDAAAYADDAYKEHIRVFVFETLLNN